jgi:hypothetical protein
MGGGMPAWRLITQKSVQEELKLNEEQIKKANALSEQLGEKQRELFESLQDLEPPERGKKIQEWNQANDKAVAEILKPDQMKRVKQISRQLAGVQAFTSPEVASEIKLTDEQKEKIKEIQQQMFEQRREIFENTPDRAEAGKKMQELNKTAAEKVVGQLNAEQKTKWKELTGKPFTGEVNFFGRRGGGGSSR